MTRSYRKGEFFFQILYSSFVTMASSIEADVSSSSGARGSIVSTDMVMARGQLPWTLLPAE